MWKNLLTYKKNILDLEKSQIFLSSNVHKIPSFEKITLTCVGKNNASIKELLTCLSGFQLLVNKKGYVLRSKKNNARLKTQKGLPIGSKVTLSKRRTELFILYLLFHLFPRLDMINLSKTKESDQSLQYIFRSSQTFRRLGPVYAYFQNFPDLQVNILKTHQKKGNILFWRIFKLPVISEKK